MSDVRTCIQEMIDQNRVLLFMVTEMHQSGEIATGLHAAGLAGAGGK